MASLKEQDDVVKDSDNHLDQDGKIIVVEFTNGQRLYFPIQNGAAWRLSMLTRFFMSRNTM